MWDINLQTWAKKLQWKLEISFHNIEIWKETRASKFGWTTASNTLGDILQANILFLFMLWSPKALAMPFHPLFFTAWTQARVPQKWVLQKCSEEAGRSEKADENRTGLIQPTAADSVRTCESIGLFSLTAPALFV